MYLRVRDKIFLNSIHGGKDQEERNEAIKLYKEGKKDVLVATDIAAKG
jgi:ATP-dependent RNA helicase DDX41